MKTALSKLTKTGLGIILGLVFVQLCPVGLAAQKKAGPVKKPAVKAGAQTNRPKVTQIDENGLKTALKPNGKPRLVNFWATWCDPCREEFPDLVKLGADYRERIDLITVSLDDPAEIDRDVPKFLSEMKAEMPAYLLRVADENAVIGSITPDWQGGLPFTILYNEKGEIAYFKQGKFKTELLRAEIDKLSPKPVVTESQIKALPISLRNDSAEDGTAEARRDISAGLLNNGGGNRAAVRRRNRP